MNILIINDYGLTGGGTERRIDNFVKMLLQQKICNQIHVLQKFPSSLPEHPSIFIHVLEDRQSSIATVKKIIHQHSIDFVQVHNLLAIEPYVLLAIKLARIPLVWWCHDYWLLCAKRSFIDPYHASKETLCPKASYGSCTRCMSWKTRMKYFIWRKIMNLADKAIAPSFIVKNIHEAHNVLHNKWDVITPWIDSSFFYKKTQKKKTKQKILLFVGSLIEFKGAWVAARALKKIVQKFPKTKLIFVGSEQDSDSRYRKDIEHICSNDHTINNIIFLGKKNKEELAELYATSDIYLCPTVCMESFGLNWAEAMAMGCPIIASSIGSIPEYIKHEKTGILFPKRDYEALADAVIYFLSHPFYAQKIGKQGMTYAHTHFHVERATDEIMRIYFTILSQRGQV